MKIERAKLLETLSKVQPGLASKEVIEQSQCFVFHDGMVSTYNDEIAVNCPTDLKINGAVEARQLFQLLNKSKAKEIELEVTEDELQIKTKKASAGIPLQLEINPVMEEIGKPKEWFELPKQFVDGIRFCMFSVSTDMTKPVLTCIHVKSNRVESCDNLRMTRYRMKKKIEGEILLPSTSARFLIKYPIKEYAQTKGWLHFQAEKEGAIFSCRTFEKKYPKLKKFMDVDGTVVTMPSKIEGILERAGIFSITDFKQEEHVRVIISKGRLTVHVKGDSGWYKERTKIKYKGEGVEFAVNPEFLKETLSLMRELTIGGSRLKLTGERFEHVVSLMILQDEDDD